MLVVWQSGRSATWDVTVAHTLAASYVSQGALQAGSAATAASERKSAKYSSLSSSHVFVPVAVETLGPLADEAQLFWQRFAGEQRFVQPIRGKPRFCTSGFLWQFSGLMPYAWPTQVKSSQSLIRMSIAHVYKSKNRHRIKKWIKQW